MGDRMRRAQAQASTEPPAWYRPNRYDACTAFFTLYQGREGRKPSGREMFVAGVEWEAERRRQREAADRRQAPPPPPRRMTSTGAVPAAGPFPYFTDQPRREARNGG